MIEKAVNPSGQTILFDDSNHTYKIEGSNKQLISCTTFIGKFTPEFDSAKHSKRFAEKNGMTQKEVLQMWEDNKVASTDLGTEVHAYAEAYMLNKELPTIKIKAAKKRIENLTPILDYLLDEFELIDNEKIIFSEKLGIAGTIDLLMKKGENIYIYDWKTNKEIKQGNSFGKMMLYPVDNLEDCNLNHYALQLNIYKTILIEEKYFPKNTKFFMCLFHITDEEIVPYRIKDLDEEVWKMISHE